MQGTDPCGIQSLVLRPRRFTAKYRDGSHIWEVQVITVAEIYVQQAPLDTWVSSAYFKQGFPWL